MRTFLRVVCVFAAAATLVSPAWALIDVAANFNGGNSSAVVDGYPGVAGDGWAGPWQLGAGSSMNMAVTTVTPMDLEYNPVDDENYLSVKSNITQSYAVSAAVSRDYTGYIDYTQPHTISFSARIDEKLDPNDPLGDPCTFTTYNDRYQFHDRPYISNSGVFSSSLCTWGISLFGWYPNNGETNDYGGRWLVHGGDGLGGSTFADTGITVTQGTVYDFTIATDPTTRTFDLTIASDGSTLYSVNDYIWANAAQTSGRVNFSVCGVKDTLGNDKRSLAYDSVHVTQAGTIQPPGGMTRVEAHFNGGNATDVVDAYKGMAGDGWNGAWQSFDWRVIPENTVVSPGDEGFNEIKPGSSGAYLKMINTGENPDDPPDGHGKSGVGRDYSRNYPNLGINWTEEHTVKFTVRIDEDVVNSGQFNTALDRYQIYDSSTPVSNYDASSAWIIQAFGAASGSVTEDMVGQWILCNGNGTGGIANWVDSNIALELGGVYDFTLVVDPATKTYDATIQYGSTTFTANDLVWRTAQDNVGGSMTFMSLIDAVGDVRAWSIDEIIISQGTTLIPGDTNDDGIVDKTDSQVLAMNWGRTDVVGPSQGDFNDDGCVNMLDASILAAHWGNHNEGSSTGCVPEPSSLILLGLGVLMLAAGRRRAA